MYQPPKVNKLYKWSVIALLSMPAWIIFTVIFLLMLER